MNCFCSWAKYTNVFKLSKARKWRVFCPNFEKLTTQSDHVKIEKFIEFFLKTNQN